MVLACLGVESAPGGSPSTESAVSKHRVPQAAIHFTATVPDAEYWHRQIKCQYACPVHTDGQVVSLTTGRGNPGPDGDRRPALRSPGVSGSESPFREGGAAAVRSQPPPPAHTPPPGGGGPHPPPPLVVVGGGRRRAGARAL